MAAQLIDGKALAAQTRESLAPRIARLREQGITPGLAALLVGDDPPSAIYVRNKIRACEDAGIRPFFDQLPTSTPQASLVERIGALNRDARVHGILVQMPLPRHIDAQTVVAAIDPDKDVDALHAVNAGLTLMGKPRFRSCTPFGVMKMIETTGIALAGAHAVVIGRSNMVGKPMAMLLLAANATVTMCHSVTRDLSAVVRLGDVVVAAAGRRNLVTADMVKPGAVVIDVGTNRTAEGSLAGDVDFERVKDVAGWISPVPGGVGPMTIAMLLVNTVQAAETAEATVSHP